MTNVESAGPFAQWRRQLALAIAGERDAEVACGTCTACCASSQFVFIGKEETAALKAIPKALRFPAPGNPDAFVMGYDQDGRCPMLGTSGCTIYESRPRTCRTYDCRVFPATGIEADAERPLIAERARRWRFETPTDEDQVMFDNARRAARLLSEQRDSLPPEIAPRTRTHLALLALDIAEAVAAEGATVADVLRSRQADR